jgi:solute:Na+ symporter, SSS family
LSCLAMYFEKLQDSGLLVLGLSVPGYVYGSILGIAILAYFGIGRFRSIIWGVILSVASIFLLKHFDVAFFWWYPVAAIVLIGTVLLIRLLRGSQSPVQAHPN